MCRWCRRWRYGRSNAILSADGDKRSAAARAGRFFMVQLTSIVHRKCDSAVTGGEHLVEETARGSNARERW